MSSWLIKAWPTVLWTYSAFCRAGFRHWNTQVLDPQRKPGTRTGQTVWVSVATPPVAVAWDWIEVRPWVVVMDDPMSILSNVELEDAHKDRLGSAASTLALNRVVHRLPWQRTVAASLWRHDPALAEA